MILMSGLLNNFVDIFSRFSQLQIFSNTHKINVIFCGKNFLNHTGITMESADKGVNGCTVQTMMRSGAVGKDGRIRLGDYLTQMNHECLRHATNSQARSILKRTNLIGDDVRCVYLIYIVEWIYFFTRKHQKLCVSPTRLLKTCS